MALYLITEEWDESDQLPNGGRTSYVYAHGNVSRRQAKKIVADMEAYSPHDYVDSMEFETKKAYDEKLIQLENLGGSIIHTKI